MLVEFRVKNFRSFREEQVLSLVAASERDESHPENLIRQDKFDLLKTAAVYGANASGKSNLVKALQVMQVFVRDSATKMNEGDSIPGVAPFRLDRQSRQAPTTLEVTGILDSGVRFEYGFSATTERVHDEWLVAYPHGKPARWFERRFDPKTNQTTWTFRSPFKKSEGALLQERTRDNGLALSRGAQENFEKWKPLYRWFVERLSVLDLSGPPMPLIMQTAMHASDDPVMRAAVLELLRQADFGIHELDLSKKMGRPIDTAHPLFRRFLSPDVLARATIHLELRALHQGPDGTTAEWFSFFEDESLGTQRFFAVAWPVLEALKRGGVLVVDELECSMHPLLTRKLIELFHSSPAANRGQPQLVFATHDTSLLDPELLRRDQIWLVEKRHGGQSELFSLHEIEDRPRANTAFARNYLAGRYGAVPQFGPIFEDLELP